MGEAIQPGRPELDVAVEADTPQVGADRVASSHVGVGLGPSRRGGVGVGAPVVEDPRDVGDAVGALGQPQDHVDVLGAVELGAKAADLLHDRAAVDAQVTGVAVRPQRVRATTPA